MAEVDHRGRVKVERSRKRVRTYLGGELVADTTQPWLVWEVPYYPAYYIPLADVRAELVATGATDHSPSRGDAEVVDIKVGRATAEGAARRYTTSPIAELERHAEDRVEGDGRVARGGRAGVRPSAQPLRAASTSCRAPVMCASRSTA